MAKHTGQNFSVLLKLAERAHLTKIMIIRKRTKTDSLAATGSLAVTANLAATGSLVFTVNPASTVHMVLVEL